ncbi:MAG: Carbamoyltransferase HypF [Phycisphaerae bacterium]|nr:Carbamoyltransferase HypF [Phycisphaerae bacterium]
MESAYAHQTQPIGNAPDMSTRRRMLIRGVVQGVGFRPFVYRLATEMSLCGWVNNTTEGVYLEVEGPPGVLDQFQTKLLHELPPLAQITSYEITHLDAIGYSTFEIRHSADGGVRQVLVLPDTATCGDCLREILDPHDRRYRYPFTNCTNCGPRYTIIERLPYDRPHTSMTRFVMCPRCRQEYENPADRRFHAQPNACPECGPQLALWSNTGQTISTRDDALCQSAQAIREGLIVAVKGIGGFHLLVDATNEPAVQRLRERKHREEKPLAVMIATLEQAQHLGRIDYAEATLLQSPAHPIVLLSRRLQTVDYRRQEPEKCERASGNRLQENTDLIAPSVAPGNPSLGIMLPYSPLHQLLLTELGRPVVATSGNISDEPLCYDEQEAVGRLGGIADLLLVHNRPIVRPVDDSVAQVVLDREMILRRARGYAPLPITIKGPSDSRPTVLAVGAHLKNSVALALGNNVFISQHIGDLETTAAIEQHEATTYALLNLYDTQPQLIACDLHPDYISTRLAHAYALAQPLAGARGSGATPGSRPTVQAVQHHYAHIVAAMAEHELDCPVLGISWDGTGYGTDGTLWGGEFLRCRYDGFERVGHLRPFSLPGGERAVREGWRCAVGLLYEIGGEQRVRQYLQRAAGFKLREPELAILLEMLTKNINSPRTSSAGRLFDAVAALIGIRQETHFEGQAAMELQFAMGVVDSAAAAAAYPFEISNVSSGLAVDWEKTIEALLNDYIMGVPAALLSLQFHETLARTMVAVAERIGETLVVLSGGCFQNRHLLERAVRLLQCAGFKVYWPQRVPPNDGGIALGQAVVARTIQSGPQTPASG